MERVQGSCSTRNKSPHQPEIPLQEIEHTMTKFTEILQEAAKLATPPTVEARQPPHIPLEIKHLIAAKR